MRNFQVLLAVLAAFATVAATDPRGTIVVDHGPITPAPVLPRAALPNPQIPTPTPGAKASADEDEEKETSEKSTETKKGDTTEEEEKEETTKGDSDSKTTSSKKGDDDDEKDTTTGKSSEKTATKTRIPATAIAGGVQMKYPNPTDGYQMYKIGDTLTFGWNYTSLIIPPSKINVEAFCTKSSYYFTITKDAPGSLKTVTWDTGDVQDNSPTKLPQATYKLFIYDSNGSRTDVPKAGYLGAFQGSSFGLYKPQPYVDWPDFECPTCEKDSANSIVDTMVLRMSVGMALIATLSFTWFAAGARA